MNFDFSTEQHEIRAQIRRFLQGSGGLAEARRVLEGPARHSTELWDGLGRLGVQGLAISEAYGGMGLGALELCVAAEELGRVLAPLPFLSSVGICAEAIQRFGSDAQRQAWLPRLATGAAVGAWGLAERPDSRCRWTDGRLSGSKAPVLDGMIADVMVVAAVDAEGEPVTVLVDLSDSGVARRDIATVDPSRPSGWIDFDGAEASLLPGAGRDAWEALSNRAAVLLAFEQLGGAEAALAMARDYALERCAFGRKIGSFQATKHKLATMYAKIELARSHCYYGAWAISTDAEQARLAAAGARCSATDAFEFAAQENVQVHGGIGVTWESDCQLFYRRARLTSLVLGSRYEWQDRLVTALECQA